MFEKQYLAVPPTLFTQNGSTNGYIVVASTIGFRVKSQVVISATGQPNLTLQLKRVISATQLVVGPLNSSISNSQVDLSAYTLAANAFIYQDQQARVTLPPPDIAQAIYEQEPVVAIRVFDVDELGNPYNADNPLPVTAVFDGSVTVGDIRITACDNDPKVGDKHSSVRIAGTDCSNEMSVNPDGSINVNVVNEVGSEALKITYNEVPLIANGVSTDLVSYTVPVGKRALLTRADVSGENIATYTIFVNLITQGVRRTYFGSGMNAEFIYGVGGASGVSLVAGDTVLVRVIHYRPYSAPFEGTIQVIEIT